MSQNEEAPAKRHKRKKHYAPRGGGSIYKKRGVYWISFLDGGVRVQMSTGKRVLSEAIIERDRVYAERHLGTFVPGASRITLADLKAAVLADHDANGLRSKKRAEQSYTHLERLIGADTPAERIVHALDRYVQTRLAETVGPEKKDEKGQPIPAKKVSPGTVNRELSYLRRGFRLLLRRRRLATMPHIELLAEHNVRTRFPSEAEVKRVMGKLADRLKDPVRFIAATGWRAREALGLAWRHVDEEAGVIRLEGHETKSGKPRVLPYAQDARLAGLIAERKAATEAWDREHSTLTPWVFWHPGVDENGQPAALPNRAYGRAWVNACKRAKVADLHLHDLRRYYARAAVRAGVDEKTIMALAGWETRSVFDRYSIRDTQDLEDGVRKLAQAALQPTAARRARES